MPTRSCLVAHLIAATLALTEARPQGVNAQSEARDNGSEPPRTLALLVGIDGYAPVPNGEDVSTLKGAVNDVARVRSLLMKQFGFDPAGIETLIGPQATHAAIVTKFHEHLIQQAGPDTRVVFWFSGHGSRIPDASGLDNAPRDYDGRAWDETLVAYDSRAVAPDGSYDLADDELFVLLRALRAKDVVVVTDCCHSGGVLRGSSSGSEASNRSAGFGSKPLDVARLLPIWPKGLPMPADDDGHIQELSHVVQIAACGADEEAGEFVRGDSTFGTCTWFLGQALTTAGADTTWAQVVERTRVGAQNEGTRRTQRVQLVGDGRRLVFGGRGQALPDGFVCRLNGAKKSMTILAGAIHGIGPGARMRLVDLNGQALGHAIVERVDVASCRADWEGPATMPQTIARAHPETFGDSTPAFRLRLGEGVAAELLSQVPFVEVTKGAADYTLERRGPGLALVDRAGRAVRTCAAEAPSVRAALLKERYWLALWHCAGAAGNYELRVRAERPTPDDLRAVGGSVPAVQRFEPGRNPADAVGPLVGVGDFDDGPASGGLLLLRIENASAVDLHVALLSVTESRAVELLLGKNEANVVPAGAEVRKVVWIGRDRSWPRDQPLVDRYLAVGTPRFADFSPFTADPSVRTRGSGDGLHMPDILHAALGDERTRGAGGAESYFGAAAIDLRLVTPEEFDRLVRR